ncbi:uncharacterized protein N0V89_009091 [Didymosphaeria variabile]|uniref:Heterokaryon incompatibility domain-containing protein n=1 Tax=Didymosphaeria variabile TaxID=1932322 RepID=A0A9W8XHI0_9PLEO|nr:uncharacterized protein N0V89_009091 [Didymosphaeria variabile]KAJ4350470.1 hypothetical protein N0V89_009091 [Didymosphaeria variabile]
MPDAQLALPSQPRVDFDLLKTWTGRCEEHGQCLPDEASELERFKVIDCETRTVQRAPEKCSFVALSYLWGPQEDFAPQPLPAEQTGTIEDAITVTLRLGFRYLWIDRYCIEQTSIMDRTLQIKQMGQIYASAHLTIIAAAGTDPRHGLPGVSQPRQVDQAVTEQIGPVTLVQLKTSAASNFQRSMWATRAWTFQEGILSKRRLVFTDEAVLYMCQSDYHHDLAPGYSSGVNYELVALAEFIQCARLPREFRSSAGSSRFKEALRYVTAYSRRNMRMSSDALNAIIGILNYISNDRKEPIFHLWGVPLAPLTDVENYFDTTVKRYGGGTPKATPREDYFEFALNWIHPKPGRRRGGFPSWSPLGWEGPIEYPLQYMDIVIPKEFDIRIHPLKDAESRPYLRHELKHGGQIQYEGKDAISTKLEIISALVAPVQLLLEDNGDARITLKDGTTLDPEFETYWDEDLGGRDSNMKAEDTGRGEGEPWLVWQIGCKTVRKRRYHYVVLRLGNDGIYERVGFIIAWKGRSDAGLLDATWADPIPCDRTESLFIA